MFEDSTLILIQRELADSLTNTKTMAPVTRRIIFASRNPGESQQAAV